MINYKDYIRFLDPSSNSFAIEFTKTTITLRTSQFISVLRTDGNAIREFRKDIENCISSDEVLKWFHVILDKKLSATLTTDHRPSWCASNYKNVNQYRKVNETIGGAIEIESIKEQKDGSFKPQYLKISTKLGKIFPHQKWKMRHFLTFEEWCSPKGVALEFYNNRTSDYRKLDK